MMKFSDWLIFQNQAISLVMMLMSISQSQYNFSQQDFTKHTLHTYIHVTHLTFVEAYNIGGSVQWKKEHQNKTHSHLLGIVSQLNEFHIIPSQIFTIYNSQSIFSGICLTSSKRNW